MGYLQPQAWHTAACIPCCGIKAALLCCVLGAWSQVTGHEITALPRAQENTWSLCRRCYLLPAPCCFPLRGAGRWCCWVTGALGGLLIGMPQPQGCVGTFGMPTSLHHSCWELCPVRWLQGLAVSSHLHRCDILQKLCVEAWDKQHVWEPYYQAFKYGKSIKDDLLCCRFRAWQRMQRPNSWG